tara:strand:- start:3303 stop:3692 length:390 start_codon:yes stop_codon:yes gene_type:complete
MNNTTDKIAITGVDANLETSLKEYGIAWHKTESEIVFIYGIEHNGNDFTSFDKCSFDLSANLVDEFNWIDESDWQSFASFIGADASEIKELPIEELIHSLVSYYGTDNIFGSSYWQGNSFDELRKVYDI